MHTVLAVLECVYFVTFHHLHSNTLTDSCPPQKSNLLWHWLTWLESRGLCVCGPYAPFVHWPYETKHNTDCAWSQSVQQLGTHGLTRAQHHTLQTSTGNPLVWCYHTVCEIIICLHTDENFSMSLCTCYACRVLLKNNVETATPTAPPPRFKQAQA